MWCKAFENKKGEIDPKAQDKIDEIVNDQHKSFHVVYTLHWNDFDNLMFMKMETEKGIKDGELQMEQGIDALTVVFWKEKFKGVGFGVTQNKFFKLPRKSRVGSSVKQTMTPNSE